MKVIEADGIVLRIASRVDYATASFERRFRKQLQWQVSEENATTFSVALLGLIFVVGVESTHPPIILLTKT